MCSRTPLCLSALTQTFDGPVPGTALQQGRPHSKQRPCSGPRPQSLLACCVQVLTCTEFHPRHCSLFAFSSSKGGIRLADMRSAALCEGGAKLFEEPADAVSPGSRMGQVTYRSVDIWRL